MTNTTHLALPLIEAAQAQKHVTHNEALAMLDALTHLSVSARNVNTPPASPSEGDRVLVGASPTGVFAGKTLQVAAFLAGAWTFLAPRAGWRVFVAAETSLLVYDGAAWVDLGLTLRELQNLTRLGVGTTADAANPFAAKLNAALLTAKTVAEGGSGDLRLALNKENAASTASQIYQSNFSARAETGLTADDNFRVKVSADGSTWKEALVADKTTGKVSAPSGRIHAATGKDVGEFVFTPGGDGVASLYRMDRTSRFQNPRTAAISAIAGDAITLTTNDADLFFSSAYMTNVSYVRIWNTSKNPVQSAWVKSSPALNQLVVLTAADISTWANGETIQLGDPTTITPNRVIAVDVSPMLQNVLGAVFRQRGLLLRLRVTAATTSATFNASPDGSSGSLNGVGTPSDGLSTAAQIVIPCSVLSPVSNSNLIFLRETATIDGTLALTSAYSVVAFA